MSETVETAGEHTEPPISDDDLRRMLEDARNRSVEAETRAQEAERRAQDAEAQRDQAAQRASTDAEGRFRAQEQAIESAISAAKADADRAETDLARALEAGDHVAAAKAQRVLAGAEARADRLGVQKDYLATNKAQLTRQPVQQQPVRPQAPAPRSSSDPLAGWDLMSTEREWLTARPKFLTDAAYQRRVLGASEMAAAEGLPRGSAEHFERMEGLLGEERGAQTQPARRPSADLAPARRAAPGAAPRSGREVRLTADQVEVADALYGDPTRDNYEADAAKRYQRYANNLQRMRDSGRLQ